MGYFDDLYEDKKKKKPSQVATQEQKTKAQATTKGGYFDDLFPVTTAAAPKKATPTPVNKPVQKPKPVTVAKTPSILDKIGSFAKEVKDSFIVGVKEAKGSFEAGTGVMIDELVKSRKENLTSKFSTTEALKRQADKLRKEGKTKLAGEFEAKANKLAKSDTQLTEVFSNTAKKLKDQSIKTFNDAKTYEMANLPIEKPKEFIDALKDPKWITKAVVRNTPNLLASLGISTATLAVTKNPAAALFVGYGTTYAQNAGGAYQDAKSFGADEKIAQKSAATVGTWAGMLDVLPIGRLLNRSPQGQAIKRSIIKEMSLSFIKQAALESSTESGQEIIANAVAKVYDQERNFFQGVPESALIGGIIGGFSGAGEDFGSAILSRPNSVKELNDKIQQVRSKPKEQRTQQEEEFLKGVDDKGDYTIPQIELLKEEGPEQKASGPMDISGDLPKVIADELNKKEIETAQKQIRIKDDDTYSSPLEKKSTEELYKDPIKHRDAYLDKYKNLVNQDLARTLHPAYTGVNSIDLDNYAVGLKNIAYEYLLETGKQRSDSNNTVLWTGGGPGSTKSTSLDNIPQAKKDKYIAIVDSTFSADSSQESVIKALAKGYKVETLFTLADPFESWKRVINRALDKNSVDYQRVVSEEYFIKAHEKARDKIVKTYDKFKDNSNYVGRFYKKLGSDSASVTDIDFIRNFTYNLDTLRGQINEYTNKLKSEGKISEELYKGFTSDRAGQNVAKSKQGSTKSSNSSKQTEQVEPQEKSTKLSPEISNYIVVVDGVKIPVKVDKNWMNTKNTNHATIHFEFNTNKIPNPISETGYKSHFIAQDISNLSEAEFKKELQELAENLAKENKPTKKKIVLPSSKRKATKLTTQNAIEYLKKYVGVDFTIQKPYGDMWKSKGNTLYIKLPKNSPWNIDRFQYSNFVEKVQEAGGPDVIKLVLKADKVKGPAIVTDNIARNRIQNSMIEGENYLKTGKKYGKKLTEDEVFIITRSVNNDRKKLGMPPFEEIKKAPTKKVAFNSREAKAMQEVFSQKIYKAQTTAQSEPELIEMVEPIVDTAILNTKTDKTTLAGLRTALNKEMFGFVGLNGSYKADYAVLRKMIDEEEPSIGKYLKMLEEKIQQIDEILLENDKDYSKTFASIGDYADLKNRTTEETKTNIVEFPELVQIAKELLGKLPQVGGSRKFKYKNDDLSKVLGGFFKAGPDSNIFLNPQMFKDPSMLAKIMAHEMGHLFDYLPDKTMARGNLLGRIGSLNKYLKTLLKETPDSEFELLTIKDRAKIRQMAKKSAGSNYELITKEIVVGTEPVTTEEILSIWRDATAGIKSPELLSYIQGLNSQKKKELVVNAMRGNIPEWVKFVKTVKETITEKVLKNSPADIKALYKKLLKEEILKRRLFDLETIKGELSALSLKWRPYNPNTASEEFNRYRRSGPELYADAISVLFNDPVMLKEEAPNFWKAFFNYADKKADVKEAILSTWHLLNKGEEAVFAERQKNVEQMFDNTEQKFTAINLEKAQKQTNLLYTLKLLFDSKNTPLKTKVNQARKEGKLFDASMNPAYAYEGLAYIDGKLEDFVQKNFQPIFEKSQELTADGWTKLGAILLYERSMMERGDMANPLGFDKKTAQDQLRGLEKSMTADEWAKLQETLKTFRESTKKIVAMAEEAEFYSPELIEQMKANPAYATYQVIDYLDTYISAHVNKSIGTLKEIANPATSTIMKGISVVKAIERNNAKKMAVEFFKANFPDEITPAKSVFKGKHMEFIESKDQDLKMIKLIEGGKMTAYYVRKDLADNINGLSNDVIIKTAKIARLITGAGIYRPLFTSLNLGFSTFNFVRDFHRYWSNIPDHTLLQAITSFPRAIYRYTEAIPSSARRALGKNDATISAMKELKILGATYNGVFEHNEVDPEDKQIERIMKQYGILDKTKHKKILLPIFKVLDAVEGFNTFIETLPKVAGYKELKANSPMTPFEMADFIRTKIGSPNFRSGGQLTPVTNSVFLFSNAIKEGIKSDFQVATGKAGKQSAAGFWWKTIASTMLPTMIMFAGTAGLFGEWFKDRMDDVSEYDKTNFTIIPTGVDKDGKTTYLRVPRAETQRFIGGLLWKIMRNANRKDLKLEDIFDVLDYGAGQLPGVTPAFTGAAALLTYLSGHNPYDAFRNRNVIPDTEFRAGFEHSFPIFIDWFVKQQGAGIILPSYVPKSPTELQRNLALPFISNVIGRWYKVSDYGKTEQYKRVTDQEDREAAKRSILKREKLDSAIKEYKSGQASFTRKKAIEKQLVKDVVGKVKTSADKTKRTNLIKEFEVGIVYGTSGPLTDSIIKADTNAQKVELLRNAKQDLGDKYSQFIKTLHKKKIISDAVLKELKKKK